MEGPSNLHGIGVRVILEGPNGVMIEESSRFSFKTSRNEVEYEALLTKMKLVLKMKVRDLVIHSW